MGERVEELEKELKIQTEQAGALKQELEELKSSHAEETTRLKLELEALRVAGAEASAGSGGTADEAPRTTAAVEQQRAKIETLREELQKAVTELAQARKLIGELIEADTSRQAKVGERCWNQFKDSQPRALTLLEDNGALTPWQRTRNALIRFTQERRAEVVAQAAAAATEASKKAEEELRKCFIKLKAGAGDVVLGYDGTKTMGLGFGPCPLIPQLLQVNGFAPGPDGEPLMAQASGKLQVGSLLVKVNETALWGYSFMEAVTLMQAKLATARNGGAKMVVTFADSAVQGILPRTEDMRYEAAMANARNDAAVARENERIRAEAEEQRALAAGLQEQLNGLLKEQEQEDAEIGRRCWERYKESMPSKLVVFPDNGKLSPYERAKNGMIKMYRKEKIHILAGEAAARGEAAKFAAEGLKTLYLRLKCGKGDFALRFDGSQPMGMALAPSTTVPHLLCVAAFPRGPDGESLPAEASGRLRPGALLVKVNDSVLFDKGFFETVVLLQAKLAAARKGGPPLVVMFAEDPKAEMRRCEKAVHGALLAKQRHEAAVLAVKQGEGGIISREHGYGGLKKLGAEEGAAESAGQTLKLVELQRQLGELAASEAQRETEIGIRCWEEYKASRPPLLPIVKDDSGLPTWGRFRNRFLIWWQGEKKRLAAESAAATSAAVKDGVEQLRRVYNSLKGGEGPGLFGVDFDGLTPMGLKLELSLPLVGRLVQVNGFARGPKGEVYPAERSGRIKPGALLVKVNDTNLWGKGFLETVVFLQGKLGTARKSGKPAVLTFAEPPTELMRHVERLKYEAAAARLKHELLSPEAAGAQGGERAGEEAAVLREKLDAAELAILKRTQALGMQALATVSVEAELRRVKQALVEAETQARAEADRQAQALGDLGAALERTQAERLVFEAEAEARAQRARDQAALLEALLGAQTARAKEATDHAAKATEARAAAERACRAGEESAANLQDKCSKLEFRCAELSSKLARAEAREREAKKQTATEEDRAARLKDQAADAERKRVEATASAQRLEATARSLRVEGGALQQSSSVLHQEVNRLRARVAELEREEAGLAWRLGGGHVDREAAQTRKVGVLVQPRNEHGPNAAQTRAAEGGWWTEGPQRRTGAHSHSQTAPANGPANGPAEGPANGGRVAPSRAPLKPASNGNGLQGRYDSKEGLGAGRSTPPPEHFLADEVRRLSEKLQCQAARALSGV
mmetsp:Transcript_12135/g.28433  ORF Transcript_12135/g.28433 Transcript_12135/m.28433 type:complete len:1211 (-) Transcript_12135:48-3680(-)